ncbi:hypothetical protein [Thermococcus waiotapuensis]|uniref:Uncharacterized protein n=1 Tax=Thermococcus waiotapuensis TaxID=90909 RepID=A0AAE4NV74_9EURY|nr:hypothetical protein [Thermococcus waiotapuensis]MDV3103246.1 hypothetical protein [Thermococcus waiotapuensis]
MDRKVVLIALASFMAVLIVGIFWGSILERANPSPPKLISLELQRGNPTQGETEGAYSIVGNILSDCSRALTYQTPKAVEVQIYELDDKMYSLLTEKKEENTTCSKELVKGTLTLQFDRKLEGLSVEIWVGETASDGQHVYFRLIGTWQFTGNSTAPLYLAPSPDKDYKLMKLEELKTLVKENGIHVIKG